MAYKTTASAPGHQKASFTVTQAAKAFRKARDGAAKVELVGNDKLRIRRDESGRFVLVPPAEEVKSGTNGRVLAGSSRKR